MNDLVAADPDLFDVVPSIHLPCDRLPFGIHQEVCSALDPYNRWMNLAADERLDIGADQVNWLENSNMGEGRSCTTAFLEYLWKYKQTTVGSLLKVLELTEPTLTDRLWNYVKGLVSKEECKRSTSACPLTHDPRTPLKQLCSLIPKPRHFVAEREDMIKVIEGKFVAMEGVCALPTMAVKIPTVVIEADPGFGKSQIARQFGEQYFRKQVGAARAVIVFTLHAGNLEELCSSYFEFGGLLGVNPQQLDTIRRISSTDLETLTNKLDTLIGLIGEKLLELQEMRHFRLQWLIIVDNLLNWQDSTKEEGNVLEFIPHCDNAKMKESYWGKGRVLITLQRGKEKFKERGGEDAQAMLSIVRLEEYKLREDMAAELLVCVADPDLEHDVDRLKHLSASKDVESVAQKLDFIPLGLVTAAVFKRSMTEEDPTFSWAQCLNEIKAALHVKVRHTQYRYGCLPEVTEITLKRLAHTSKILQMAFIAVGYCDYQNIPDELIRQFIQKQISVQDDMQMTKLNSCPLLSCTSASAGADKTYQHRVYRMHQVTHSILQGTVLPKWEGKLAVPHFRPLLGVALNVNEESDLMLKGFLGSHLFSLATHARKQFKEQTMERQWKEIPEIVCAAVCSSNLSPVAMHTQLEYIQDCVKMSKEIAGVTSTDKARYMSVECGALAGSGKGKEARVVGSEALKMMVKENAPAELIASSLESLSWHYGNEIHFGIETIESHLHYVEEASGGSDTKQYAIALMQLGELWKKIDRNKGREALERAVDILSRDEDSLDFAVALGYYARFLLTSWSASDIREALKLCKRSASIVEKVVSKDTMLHIDRYSTLGRAYMTNLCPTEAIRVITPYVKKVKELHGTPGAQWRLQQALAVSHLMSGNIDKSLYFFRKNIRLQKDHDIHVSRIDRRLNKLATVVLPVVNRLLVRPLVAVCSRLRRKGIQTTQQPAIDDDEDMEVD